MMKKFLIRLFLTFVLFSGTNVASSETISLATVDWPPIYGTELPENGFFAALSREVCKRAGYELEIAFVPWKRAVELAKRGKFDGILGAYYSDERAKYFNYPDPVVSNDEVFVQKKGQGITYTVVDDLKKFKIGGLRGSAQLEELEKMGFTVEATTDDIMSIKKLSANRIDLMIIGKAFLLYTLKNSEEMHQYKEAFEILEPPYKSYELYCPISKKIENSEKIVEQFNAALQSMKGDGTYQSTMERFGMQ